MALKRVSPLSRRRAPQGDARFGHTLHPDSDCVLAEGVHGREVQVCHRLLRRNPHGSATFGSPSRRTKIGITFSISCWANEHQISTPDWTIRYSAVNSLTGWNYRVMRFAGDLTAFQRAIMMVRTIS